MQSTTRARSSPGSTHREVSQMNGALIHLKFPWSLILVSHVRAIAQPSEEYQYVQWSIGIFHPSVQPSTSSESSSSFSVFY